MKILDWIKRLDPNHDLRIGVDNAIKLNEEFISSLDDRQIEYYLGLGNSWRKEFVRLEERIRNLEDKFKDPYEMDTKRKNSV